MIKRMLIHFSHVVPLNVFLDLMLVNIIYLTVLCFAFCVVLCCVFCACTLCIWKRQSWIFYLESS